MSYFVQHLVVEYSIYTKGAFTKKECLNVIYTKVITPGYSTVKQQEVLKNQTIKMIHHFVYPLPSVLSLTVQKSGESIFLMSDSLV